MKIKNNYEECLTNLVCSIQKYFGIEPKHNTLSYIDDLLNAKKPNNVILILMDGMGSRIINRNLEKNSFFIQNELKEITTVFPATTVATTSIRSGLNPVEHGWLGWNMYIHPIDETIALFKDTKKENEQKSMNYNKVKNKLEYKTISEQINENTKYNAIELFPFETRKTNIYNSIDDMINIVKDECSKEGKKYIYVYDIEPDHTMHDYGPDSNEVLTLIKEREEKIEKLCDDLKDSIVFITADHGHKLVEPIFLKNYPELYEMLERTTSIEQRSVSFKIKDGFKKMFKNKFVQLFGDDFKLYEKQKVINSNLFGNGKQHELFEEAIGDFIAIAYDSNKCIITEGDEVFTSHHAGYSDDEIYVPLIVIDKTK